MRSLALLPAALLASLLACGNGTPLEESSGDEDPPGSLCACRELEGLTECCFGHGTCENQDEGPSRCECDPGARGETCSTPAPGVHAVRPRTCDGDDPGCARDFEFVSVEAFDTCVDLGGQSFESTIVRPATSAGAWPSDTPLPVAVLTHGASQDPADYYDLLEHIAANGVVVAAFDATAGEDVTFRANRLLSYLICLRTQWSDAGQLSDRYALVGHSRGGSAVAVASEAIAEGVAAPGVEVAAVVALAPTRADVFALSAAATPAYFTLQGARDPDTRGASLAWFDQAGDDSPSFIRALTWVFGATHQRFHQGLLFSGSGELQASLSAEGHWTVARAYVGGFVLWRLLGRDDYRKWFTGEQVPASVAAHWDSEPGVFAGLTDGNEGRRIIHAFESDALSPSTEGGTVSATGFSSTSLAEFEMLDPPWSGSHQGRGLRVDVSAGQAGSLQIELLAGSRDLSAFASLSLRLGRTFDSDAQSCAEPGPLPSLSLVLHDGLTQAELELTELEQAGRVEAPDRFVPETFGSWVDPDCHAVDFMRALRVPLAAFCARGIDLSDIRSLELRVDGSHAGGLLIDTLMLERGETELPGCP